jgi:prepilin-type N-terminal cleavage/methylation domain-containing protein
MACQVQHLQVDSIVGLCVLRRPKGVSVKQSQLNTQRKERCRSGQRGFSMIELCTVILIILIISAMAIFALMPALQDAKFDSAMRQVLDQLRQAREYSIANRRYVQVTFPTVVAAGVTQYQIVMTERNAPPYGPAGAGADVVLSTVPIQPPAQFLVNPAAVDTPDNFGNASAIEFEGQNPGPVGGMLFQSDGELIDGLTFQPINGSIFIGSPGKATAFRAITVLGSTGRVRAWKFNGAAWLQF